MATARAPKYQRVANDLRQQVQQGELSPGEQLPAETFLVDRYRVSLPTVRQALAVLRAEGLITSVQGVGTFVKDERRLQRRSRKRYQRARQDQKLLTSHLRHDIIFAGKGPAPPYVASILGISAEDEVVIRRRVLYDENDQPREVGASYISTAIAGGTFLEEPTVVPKALFLCVEDFAEKQYANAHDQWIARPPTTDEADALDLPTGAYVIHVLHTARAEDGTVLEVSESSWPADQIVIVDEYDIVTEPEQVDTPSDI